jgi:starvation-inducible DNA-binding protein
MNSLLNHRQSTATTSASNHSQHPLSDLAPEGVAEISETLRHLLADVFALYVKTKNFHWHMTGRHFRDYHLLLDEHGDQLFGMTDPIAERARKLGGTSIRSIGDIARHQRLSDSDEATLTAEDMLAQLLTGNQALTVYLREAHEIAGRYDDTATASLIENWIDETERRSWFLYEILRDAR